jgi:hypothetical protein
LLSGNRFSLNQNQYFMVLPCILLKQMTVPPTGQTSGTSVEVERLLKAQRSG